MAKEDFYKKETLDGTFEVFEFGFEADRILVIQDGTGDWVFSWDGKTGTNDGDLIPTDGWIQFDGLEKSRIFIKTDNPGDEARVWAWRRSS